MSRGRGRRILRTISGLLLLGLFLMLAWLPGRPEAAPPDMPSRPSPGPPLGKGVFLIANPQMLDPNFRETVILICEHDPEQGTVGVIVNRPTPLRLSDVLPKISVLKGTSYVLFAGGPVQPEGILMLFRMSQAPAEMRRVLDGIYLGGDLATLERIIQKPEPTETFRAYAGYAGWAPGQLEAEVSIGSWATVAADPLSIFDKDPAGLWRDLLEALQAPGVVHLSPIPPSVTTFLSSTPAVDSRSAWTAAFLGIIERTP